MLFSLKIAKVVQTSPAVHFSQYHRWYVYICVCVFTYTHPYIHRCSRCGNHSSLPPNTSSNNVILSPADTSWTVVAVPVVSLTACPGLVRIPSLPREPPLSITGPQHFRAGLSRTDMVTGTGRSCCMSSILWCGCGQCIFPVGSGCAVVGASRHRVGVDWFLRRQLRVRCCVIKPS